MASVPATLPSFADVQAAAARLRGHVVRTPLLQHPVLDALTGGTVVVKPEPLQRTGSFKLRGAMNAALLMDPAARQGGIVSFTLRAGEDAALKVAANTELFTLAESLGAVESLIEHPGRMTHASVADAPGAVDPALVRLSVGLERADDLILDLVTALDRL